MLVGKRKIKNDKLEQEINNWGVHETLFPTFILV